MKAQTRTQRKRMATRRKLVGAKGVNKQEVRKAKSIMKAAVTPGDSVVKAKGREAIKRVGEYKAGAKKKGITTDYKAPNHGRRKR